MTEIAVLSPNSVVSCKEHQQTGLGCDAKSENVFCYDDSTTPTKTRDAVSLLRHQQLEASRAPLYFLPTVTYPHLVRRVAEVFHLYFPMDLLYQSDNFMSLHSSNRKLLSFVVSCFVKQCHTWRVYFTPLSLLPSRTPITTPENKNFFFLNFCC